MIGSDEVFNCLSERLGYVSQLFGNIPGAKTVLSYAASCGHSKAAEVPPEMKAEIAKHLQGLKAISVRDENTASFVREIAGKTPEYHLDPALAHDFDDKLRDPGLSLPGHYCLIYAYGGRIRDGAEIERIKRFCREKKLKIITVGGMQNWAWRHYTVEPFELLWLFRNADFVVTDTFHGTIFSYKYAKRFGILLRDSNRNKLGDLVNRLHIEKHLLHGTEEMASVYSQMNDPAVNKRFLASERERSLEYLKENIYG